MDIPVGSFVRGAPGHEQQYGEWVGHVVAPGRFTCVRTTEGSWHAMPNIFPFSERHKIEIIPEDDPLFDELCTRVMLRAMGAVREG